MFCLSVENVLFDQDDDDVAGMWCVVIAVTKREWRRPSPPFLPTPVPTPNPTYTYIIHPILHIPTYNIHSYLHLDLPTTPNSTNTSTIHRLPETKEEYFGDSECATMID